MTNRQIEFTLRKLCEYYEIPFDPSSAPYLKQVYETEDFIVEIRAKSESTGILLLENWVHPGSLEELQEENPFPILFLTEHKGQVTPVISYQEANKKSRSYFLLTQKEVEEVSSPTPILNDQGKTRLFSFFRLDSIANLSPDQQKIQESLSPADRLIKMLKMEKKDIFSIYTYALLIGAISLVLPLGIQAIIGMVQGGLYFSSIYVLIALVIVALVVSGIMQVMQLTVMEYLQERLFAKAAFDYTYRLPRVKTEALMKYYPPELMNRFFDIITVQKTLPKLLIDTTAAIIQIIFGLFLLAAYHPLFIAFSVVTILLIVAVVRVLGKNTLDINILKSKSKYKIAQWLQDIARTLYAFKVSGNPSFPLNKMERHVNTYLKYRKKYFDNILIIFYNAVFFKSFVTAGLLILGTYLVIDRQITIGQFVASEIVIVLVIGSVEKILLSVDSIFDLLTAVDKLGQVSDLPLEPNKGVVKHLRLQEGGLTLDLKDLNYRYEDSNKPVLNNLSLSIKSNEKICIVGKNGSGKETLMNIMAGILTDYEGTILYNQVALRDIERDHLHEIIERNVTSEGIFNGTLLENITMNRPKVSLQDTYEVLGKLQLNDTIGSLKEGLQTEMISGGRRFSSSFAAKVALARCIVNKPKLLLVSESYEHLDRPYIQYLLDYLTDPNAPWTFVTVSNDPAVMAACDRVCVLEQGQIVLEGPYEEIKSDDRFITCTT